MKLSKINIFNVAIFIIFLAFCLSSYGKSIDGKSIALKGGNNGATACASCHGKNGEGMQTFPYLAGLPVQYIKNQLEGYKQGSRNNAVMKSIVLKLSSKETDAVARYYSQLQNKQIENISLQNSKKFKQGQSLVATGKWQSGIPACVKCHGEDGKGVSTEFPPIVGQPYEYIRDQLLAWKASKRTNDPLGLMQNVANNLDQDEIETVAHYLASQSGQ